VTTVDTPRARMVMYGVVILVLVLLAVAGLVAWRHARAAQVCADSTRTVTRAELAVITAYCPEKLGMAGV
jgi:hypothetical protein